MNKRIYKKWHTAKSNPNLRMRTLRAIIQKDLPDFDRGRFIQIVQTVAYNNPENTEMICDLIHHSITLPIVSPYQYFIHTINGIYGMYGTTGSERLESRYDIIFHNKRPTFTTYYKIDNAERIISSESPIRYQRIDKCIIYGN